MVLDSVFAFRATLIGCWQSPLMCELGQYRVAIRSLEKQGILNRLMDEGFEFQFAELEPELRDLVRR